MVIEFAVVVEFELWVCVFAAVSVSLVCVM